MQAGPNSQGESRHDWWRRTRRPGADRAARWSDQIADVVTIREPGDGHVSGRTEPKGPDLPCRSHGVRQGDARYRQALQVKRAPAGYRISGTRACSREGNNYCELAREEEI